LVLNGIKGNWGKELNNPFPNKTYNMENEISFVTTSYPLVINDKLGTIPNDEIGM